MDIDEWRMKIDDVDLQLLKLLNQRAGYALEIGRIKKQRQIPVYSPEREQQIFARVTAVNAGPLSNAAVRRLFERIIDENRTLEKEAVGEI